MNEIQHGRRSDNAFEITYQAVRTHEGGQRFCRLYHKYSRISPRSIYVEILAQWNVRYSEVLDCKMTNVTDAEKILLMRQRSSSVDRSRYLNSLFPQKPSYLTFSNTAQLMSKPFVDNTCIFIDIDIVEYSGVVNKLCTGFRDYSQSEQQFCCLLFVPDQQSEEYARIPLTLLAGWIEIQTSTTLLT